MTAGWSDRRTSDDGIDHQISGVWEYQLKVVPAKIRYRCLRDPDEDVIEPMRRPYRSQNARADRHLWSPRADSPASARIRVDCRGVRADQIQQHQVRPLADLQGPDPVGHAHDAPHRSSPSPARGDAQTSASRLHSQL